MRKDVLFFLCFLASTLSCLAQTGTPEIGKDYGGGMVFDIKEVKTQTSCKKEIYVCSKVDDPQKYNALSGLVRLTKDFNNDPNRNAGFKDWYVPSNNELTALYENLHKKGLGGFKQIEYTSNNRFRIVFKTGEKFDRMNPTHSYSTRMIRKVTENCGGITPTTETYVVEMLGRQGTLEFPTPISGKPTSAKLDLITNGKVTKYLIAAGTWDKDVFYGQIMQGDNPAVPANLPGTSFNKIKMKQTTGTYALTGAVCYNNSNSWVSGSTLLLGHGSGKSLTVKSTAKPLFALVVNDKHAGIKDGEYSYGWYIEPSIAVTNNFRMVHMVIDDVLKETALYAFENKDGRSETEALAYKIAFYKTEEIMANLNTIFSNVYRGDVTADLGALLLHAAQLKYPSKHLGLTSSGHGSPIGIMNGFFGDSRTIKRSLGWVKDIRGGNISFLDFGTNCNVASLFNLSNVAPYVDFVLASDMTRNSPMPFSLWGQRPDSGGNYSGYFKDESETVRDILGAMADKYGALFNSQESKDWAKGPNPSPVPSKQQLTLFDMSQFPKILQNIGGEGAVEKCEQLVSANSTALESLYYNDDNKKYLDFKMAIPVLFPQYTGFSQDWQRFAIKQMSNRDQYKWETDLPKGMTIARKWN